MRIDINLASQPYEDSRRFWTYWGTGLALHALATALVVSLSVTGFIDGSRDRQQIRNLKNELARFDQERSRAEATLNRRENRDVRDRSRFLNELFARKAFSWTRVFEDLERVMPAHLRVLSIHPEMAENNLELKLVVGGETRDQALDLVRKMENSKHFRQTHIESERFQVDATTDRVQFNINALYVPMNETGELSGGMD
jgi:type IV pilus assembly protein PilN